MTRPLRVLTIGPAPAGPDSRGGMASVMTLLAEHPADDVEIRVVPTFVDGSVLRRLWVGVRGMLFSSWLVLVGRVDVLHVHLAHGGSVVRKSLPLTVARLRGVATVVHAHSYDFTGWLDGLPSVAQRVVRRALAADRWIVLGSSHVEAFAPRLQMPVDRVVVLHNPAVLPGFSGPLREHDPLDPVVIVSLGRLGHRKGSFEVVAAAATLPEDVRARVRIVLAGDGDRDDVENAVAEAGVGDVVEIRSWLDPAQRDALMNEAEVFILPSHDEGLPMALLESMAAGLAPIVSPVGGIPNVVTDGQEGLIVQPGDVEGIAKAIRRVVDDPDLRLRLRETARERSRDFGVTAWYEDLASLWREISDRPRR